MINITQEQIMQNWGVDNSDSPIVSVRCITYNHEPYIAQALDGFLMQKTNFPFEVVVHDDASTDKTADIIREYEKKFPKIIKPIYETENQYSKHDGSLARIVNAALKGKYVAFCEGDDYWIDENKLQMQVDFLEKNPEYGMCFSNAKIEQDFVILKRNIPNIKKNGQIRTSDVIKNGGMFIPTPSILLKKSLLTAADYPDFCKKCWIGDYPLQIWCAIKEKVYAFNNNFVIYRKNSIGSWTSKVSKNSFKEKKLGIESELIMLNGFNRLTNFKFNKFFMIRKIFFIGKNINFEKKLVFEGKYKNFYILLSFMYRLYFCLLRIYHKLCGN